ncbi:galactosylceramide sulfotransferase-like [Antedon mediterranea]|uniref:galactosylceramide sulfotransferase-like n=1 Tax=Antedon mediterranea TaxID=105859 RepID=UPI003AF6B7BD
MLCILQFIITVSTQRNTRFKTVSNNIIEIFIVLCSSHPCEICERKILFLSFTRPRPKIDVQKCHPGQTIVFLKTHKTGSTTLARIIELYGFKHSLTFVRKIGEKGSIHFSNQNFNKKSVRKFLPPPNVTKGDYANYKYNIFTLHVRYNRAVLDTFMKEDPVYITILREPSAQFESAFSFFKLGRYIKKKTGVSKFQNFLSKPKKYPKAVSASYSNNGQMFDLGLPKKDFRSVIAINKTIARLDKQMNLVLVNEYYDESLVLLSKLLCWNLEDLLYLPKNERPESNKSNMSEDIHQKARDWNHADTMLYSYFLKRLHKRITDYGPSFQQDLLWFRNMKAELRRNCVNGTVVGKKRMRYQSSNSSKTCEYHTEEASVMDKRIRKLMGASH